MHRELMPAQYYILFKGAREDDIEVLIEFETEEYPSGVRPVSAVKRVRTGPGTWVTCHDAISPKAMMGYWRDYLTEQAEITAERMAA